MEWPKRRPNYSTVSWRSRWSFVANKIRVTCPDCGDQEVLAERVSASVCVDTHDAEYRFTCPACVETVTRTCDERVIDALESVDVKVEFWSRRPRRDADQFTLKDVRSFRNLLNNEPMLEAALIDLAA